MSTNIATKLLNALDKAISPPPDYSLPAAMAAIGREIGPVLTADELAKARECQRDWQRCADAVTAHFDSEAKKAWMAHGATVTDRMLDGSFPTDEHCWSREHWEADFASRRELAKEGMHRASARSLPLLKKAGERFAKATLKIAADLEATEQANAEKYRAPYAPSVTVLRLRECAQYATHIPTDGPTLRTAPKDMAPYLAI